MKKIFLTLTLILTANLIFAQFQFSVQPGFTFNGAKFGYKMGPVIPGVAIQHAGLKFTYKESGQRYDFGSDQVENYSRESVQKLNVYLPAVNLKYILGGDNDLQPYLNASLIKPIVTGEQTTDGETNDNFKEELESFSSIGFSGGFGVEYFLSDHFSLGGEFGLQFVNLSYENTFEPYSPGDETLEATEEWVANVSLTYSNVSFNYYF